MIPEQLGIPPAVLGFLDRSIGQLPLSVRALGVVAGHPWTRAVVMEGLQVGVGFTDQPFVVTPEAVHTPPVYRVDQAQER